MRRSNTWSELGLAIRPEERGRLAELRRLSEPLGDFLAEEPAAAPRRHPHVLLPDAHRYAAGGP